MTAEKKKIVEINQSLGLECSFLDGVDPVSVSAALEIILSGVDKVCKDFDGACKGEPGTERNGICRGWTFSFVQIRIVSSIFPLLCVTYTVYDK